ncbi:PH domain-containing protein [Crocosphaera sp. UHCC 0190]|uniref:PH domain-containing protein n=1 Tax=Crocosphaera sp. UHCC 0190 TaxID=3110246 RepID=UPI002B1EE1FF|nr:PH domain-containing protein [Crocosphaera sp. UHCC 0190]MEA5509276.1 PH domain-containing protein [Crocosphaera sp. UHCC 0190]
MSQIFPIIPPPDKTFWSLGIFILLMLGILCLFFYIAYSSSHLQVELNAEELRIRGDLYGRNIPVSSLVVNDASIIELDKQSPYYPSWRTNGIGLPGYLSGWFKLKNGDKGLLFVTDKKQVLYLPTDEDYSLLMSIKEPENFLEALQKLP